MDCSANAELAWVIEVTRFLIKKKKNIRYGTTVPGAFLHRK